MILTNYYRDYGYYSSSSTSSTSSTPYAPYVSGNVRLPDPVISKKILQNAIGHMSICCIDSKERYHYPVLFYIAGNDGEEHNGYYIFAITPDGELQTFTDITMNLDLNLDEKRRLKIMGVDLLW